MNTWGEVIRSLVGVVNSAADEAHRGYYQTPSFFIKRNLLIHRAFDRWCASKGVPPENRGKMLAEVRAHVLMYYPPGSIYLKKLWETLPDEFNVRGKWTSEFLR